MGDDFIKGDGEIYVETNYMFLKNHSSHHQESPILFQVKHHTKNDTGKINRGASFRWSFGPHSAWSMHGPCGMEQNRVNDHPYHTPQFTEGVTLV